MPVLEMPGDRTSQLTESVVSPGDHILDVEKFTLQERFYLRINIDETSCRENSVPPAPDAPEEAEDEDFGEKELRHEKFMTEVAFDVFQRIYGSVQQSVQTMKFLKELLKSWNEFFPERHLDELETMGASGRADLAEKMSAEIMKARCLEEHSLNPYKNQNSTEYFVLPRPRASVDNVVYNKNASHIEFEDQDNLEFSAEAEVVELKNLVIYDPRFHDNLSEIITHRGLYRALAARLSSCINNHCAFGITLPALEKKFKDEVGPLDFDTLGFRTPVMMIKEINDIFWIVTEDLPAPMDELVFPKAQEGVMCSVNTLLGRVWHAYKAAIGLKKKPASVEETFTLCLGLLGLNESEFKLSQWGFDSTVSFVKFCIEFYRVGSVYILENLEEATSESQLSIHPPEKQFYVSKRGPSEKLPRNFRSVGQKFPAPQEIISLKKKQMFRLKDLKFWNTDVIQVGDVVSCSHGLSMNPAYLGFVLTDQIAIYDSFREHMTRVYKTMTGISVKKSKLTEVSLDWDAVFPGTLLAAYFMNDWRRAVYVRPSADKLHMLFLVDGGVFARFKPCRIANLLEEFLDFSVQGILGRLDFGTLGIEDVGCRKFRERNLKPIRRASQIIVKFLSKTDFLGHPYWTLEIEGLVGLNWSGKAVEVGKVRDTSDEITHDLVARTVFDTNRRRKGLFKIDHSRVASSNGGHGAILPRFSIVPTSSTKETSGKRKRKRRQPQPTK